MAIEATNSNVAAFPPPPVAPVPPEPAAEVNPPPPAAHMAFPESNTAPAPAPEATAPAPEEERGQTLDTTA
jgi:hypothetical protein